MSELKEKIQSVLIRTGVNGVDVATDAILDAVIQSLPDQRLALSNSWIIGYNQAIDEIRTELTEAKSPSPGSEGQTT